MNWKEEGYDELESESFIVILIGALIFTINCSSNYFVYRYLLKKEKDSSEKKSKFHIDLSSKDGTGSTGLTSFSA